MRPAHENTLPIYSLDFKLIYGNSPTQRATPAPSKANQIGTHSLGLCFIQFSCGLARLTLWSLTFHRHCLLPVTPFLPGFLASGQSATHGAFLMFNLASLLQSTSVASQIINASNSQNPLWIGSYTSAHIQSSICPTFLEYITYDRHRAGQPIMCLKDRSLQRML